MLTREAAIELQQSQRTISLLTCGEMRNDLTVISMARQCLETEASRDEPNPTSMRNLLAYIKTGEQRLEKQIRAIEQGKEAVNG